MSKDWDVVIKPQSNWFDIRIKELILYKDLLFMFVRRDVVTVYKQTILGPVWYFVQPILTMFVFVVVFGGIAGISTDGVPQPLFYLGGIIIWNYFSECFLQTSDTFAQNQQIFGKVYFPRLIVPMSKVISGLIKFFIQFLLFLGVFIYFLVVGKVELPGWELVLVPFLIMIMAGLGLGFGLVFTSFTTKYRDLKFLVQFGVQLVMYSTPIIYPMSSIQGEMRDLISLNPLAHIVETFKHVFLGTGELNFSGLMYSTVFMLVILLSGILIFNKTERSFMDTV